MNHHFLDKTLNFFIHYFSMMLLVIAPIKPTLIAVAVIICADLLTGVMASRKLGEKITSQKLKKTIGKLFIYEFGLLMCFVLETWLIPDVPCSKAFAGYIGMVEGKSLFENMYHITGINVMNQIMTQIQQVQKKEQRRRKSNEN